MPTSWYPAVIPREHTPLPLILPDQLSSFFCSVRIFKAIKLVKKLAIIVVIVVMCLVLGMASPVLAGGLSVSGGKIETSVSPGSNSTYVITVSNASTAPMDIGVTIEGYGVSLTNDFIGLTPSDDTNPYSARTWLSVTPSNFNLNPGDSQNVTVTVNVPAGTGKGGRYAIVMIQTIPPPGQQVATVSAVAARVLLTVSGYGVDTSSQITGVTQVNSTSQAPAAVMVTLADSGNFYLYPEIDVTLMKGNQVMATGSVDTGWPLLPGYSRQYQLNLTGNATLPSGSYEAEIEVKDGSGNTVTQKTLPVSFATNQVLGTQLTTSTSETTSTGTTPATGTTSTTGTNWQLIIDIAAGVIILILILVVVLLLRKHVRTIGK